MKYLYSTPLLTIIIPIILLSLPNASNTFQIATPSTSMTRPPTQIFSNPVPSTPPTTPSSTPSRDSSISTQRRNEIDFCLSPLDSSLSQDSTSSVTRSINAMVNANVRRIMLSRSWPSKEMTAVLLKGSPRQQAAGTPKLKCPVPRPILNILTKSRAATGDDEGMDKMSMESAARQMKAFRDKHGSGGAGVEQAEAFLECVFSLSVEGVESEKVSEVFAGNVYGGSYRRLVQVSMGMGVRDGAGDGSDKQ
jgi:hypothetical protein